MKQVNIGEAQAQLARLLEEVEDGARIVIARAGEPIAVLVPYKAVVQRRRRRRRLGQFAGEAKIHDDFDDLSADIMATFGME